MDERPLHNLFDWASQSGLSFSRKQLVQALKQAAQATTGAKPPDQRACRSTDGSPPSYKKRRITAEWDRESTPTGDDISLRVPQSLLGSSVDSAADSASCSICNQHIVDLEVPAVFPSPSSCRRRPAPLNLAIPGSKPSQEEQPQTSGDLTLASHYIAIPPWSDSPVPTAQDLEAHIQDETEETGRLSPKTCVKIVPSPLPILSWDCTRPGRNYAFDVRPLDGFTGNLDDAFTKFTLATPATARFPRISINAGEPSGTATRLTSLRLERVCRALKKGKGRIEGRGTFDLIASLSQSPENIVEVCKYLGPTEILNLYCTSKAFHDIVDVYMTSSIRAWARIMAPDAASIFQPAVYIGLCVLDPVGRLSGSSTQAGSRLGIRRVPSLRWLQMVVYRERIVEHILAHMARYGLRCPRGSRATLLKLWMVMEKAHNAERGSLLADRGVFRDADLLYAQIFFVKLALHFNDPLYGPASLELFKLVMAQRGFTPLWEMLLGRSYRNTFELLQLKIRTDFEPAPGFQFRDILGIRSPYIGTLRLDPSIHDRPVALHPPYVLVAFEAARRRLDLDAHLMHLLLWGHIDQRSGRNLTPTHEEICMDYLTDKTRQSDVTLEFTALHCKKAQWSALTRGERQSIIRAENVWECRMNEFDRHRYDLSACSDGENEEANDMLRELFRMAVLDEDGHNEFLKTDRKPKATGHLLRARATAALGDRFKDVPDYATSSAEEDGGDDAASVSSLISRASGLSGPLQSAGLADAGTAASPYRPLYVNAGTSVREEDGQDEGIADDGDEQEARESPRPLLEDRVGILAWQRDVSALASPGAAMASSIDETGMIPDLWAEEDEGESVSPWGSQG